MSPRTYILLAVGAIAVVVLVVIGVSSSGESIGPGAGDPASAEVDYEAALADAPRPLARLYSRANQLIPGGLDALEAEIAKLRGYPVVVNLWAEWCGPCRFEFPHFQAQAAKRGERVAFLGVDTEDSDDAARTFLEDFPVPYPSISDPDREIHREIRGVGLPVTAFYGPDGGLRYVKHGPYTDEAALAADIERYAR
jgi:thiol-disulfide isomerase/thioredoxin